MDKSPKLRAPSWGLNTSKWVSWNYSLGFEYVHGDCLLILRMVWSLPLIKSYNSISRKIFLISCSQSREFWPFSLVMEASIFLGLLLKSFGKICHLLISPPIFRKGRENKHRDSWTSMTKGIVFNGNEIKSFCGSSTLPHTSRNISLNSTLLQADMAKYCKEFFMPYTKSYKQVQAAFHQHPFK